MPRLITQTKRLYLYAKLLKTEPSDLRAVAVTEATLLKHAKVLHAEVYLRHGYVTSADLLESGIIGPKEDPYQDHSQYFVVERRVDNEWRVIAASRLILHHEAKRHQSFQTYVHQELTSEARSIIEATSPERSAEVSALVKARGETTAAVLMLYRSMWCYALEHDLQLLIMSCDARLFDRIKLLFGSALHLAGTKTHFKGHDVVPLILRLDHSLRALTARSHWTRPVRRLLKKRLTAFMLRELNASALPHGYRRQMNELKLK